MKSIVIFILSAGVLFISCKKDRVCSCTVITSGTTSTHTTAMLGAQIDTTIVTPLSTTNTNDITYYKVTKKVAQSNCFNKSETINESSQSGFYPIVTIITTNTGTRNYDCKLK